MRDEASREPGPEPGSGEERADVDGRRRAIAAGGRRYRAGDEPARGRRPARRPGPAGPPAGLEPGGGDAP